MRKIGWLSFALYSLLTLFCGGVIIYVSVVTNSSEGSSGNLALVVYLILAIIFGVAGLVGVILKLIHMKSGWKFFGVLCIALDIAFVVAFVGMAAPGGNIEQITAEDILPSIPFIVTFIASAVVNAVSLKD